MNIALMLPTNWDNQLIERVAPLGPHYLYGSLPAEATLRSSLAVAEATEQQIAAHVAAASAKRIRFIYVMNATCLGNREFSEEGRRDILDRLQWVGEIGAAGVVTANPFLMELLRQNFPGLELHVSVLACVDDPRKAAWFEGLGAAVIHLDPQVNRDFRRLRAIRRAVSCRLSVVVNEGCILSCPIRQYHANMISHSRESIAGRYHVDYCYYKCSLFKERDPAEYLRAPWIRPEDVHIYEALGIQLFKVGGREKMEEGPASHTDWIAEVAAAYHVRQCDDVARLLIGTPPVVPLFNNPVKRGRIRLNSRRLDGFLRFFQDDRCHLDCSRCDYCGRWAAGAVHVEGENEEYGRVLEAELRRIRLGSYRTTC
jgi:collagenase-like PrtC family protease